jgi:hypothetical protein
MLRVASMAGLVKLHCGNWARDEWPVWAVHVALMSRLKLQVDHHLPPQRHLNPRMQFCPVSTRDNPLKSAQRHRKTIIRLFDFKGL